MGINPFIFFSWFLICICQIHIANASSYEYLMVSCVPETGNYTNGSSYQKNLETLMSRLDSQGSTRMFDNSTAGDGPSKIYVLYQCRGDINQATCNECIQDASNKIIQECPLYKEAVVWYDKCVLRYANYSIFSLSKTYPGVNIWSRTNVSDYDKLGPVLATTLNGVINDAAQISSKGHFAIKAANWTMFDKVYCLAQCTPDINEFDCRNCLTRCRYFMINNYNTSMAVTIYAASCQLGYDSSQQFYLDSSSNPPGSSPSNTTLPKETPTTSLTNSGLSPSIIAGIVVGASVGVILLVFVVWFCLRRPNKSKASQSSSRPPPSPEPDDGSSPLVRNHGSIDLGEADFVQYDFATLKAATNDFSAKDNKLGEGGFGMVYLGTLKSGTKVAIKRLSAGNTGQGAEEFMTEARLIAKLQHRNLVKLLGFCSEGTEKLLVYEFLPNSSLDLFLTDPTKQLGFNWETRYKIIMGVARGIQYLHEDSRLTIIHRDLKPNNILLDIDMTPKIADFGTARLFAKEEKSANTIRIVGTLGYMPPEYLLTGEYSEKTDVYSFGIIILELVSGRKNRKIYQSSQKEDLAIQAWRLWEEDRASEFVDPRLYNNCSKSEVIRCIQIGLLCLQQNALYRPTMANLVLMLTSSIALPPPTSPITPHQFNLPVLSEDDGHQSDQSSSLVLRNDIEHDLYPR